MSHFKSGLSLAAAAATLALSPNVPAADSASGKAIDASDKVHCYGVNFCNSRCSTSNPACRNRRECNEPWITTARNCLDKGGSLEPPDSPDKSTRPAQKHAPS